MLNNYIIYLFFWYFDGLFIYLTIYTKFMSIFGYKISIKQNLKVQY